MHNQTSIKGITGSVIIDKIIDSIENSYIEFSHLIAIKQNTHNLHILTNQINMIHYFPQLKHANINI